MDFLKGKKTYILGGIMALQAVAQWLTGEIVLQELLAQIPTILTGLGLMTLRAGVGK